MRPFSRVIPGLLLACLAATGLGCAPGRDDTGKVERVRGIGLLDARELDSRAADGYVLFSPLLSTVTYLVDKQGRAVHTWESELPPGVSVYLLNNGHLLRTARHPGVPFRGGGQGGRLQEFDWDGELVWDWVAASAGRVQHHDIEPLPNGNVLLIVWENKSPGEARRAGRRSDLLGLGGLWPDAVLEVEPRPPDDARVVWEWHLWDHLIQDHDPALANFGRLSEHPGLVDLNAGRGPERPSEALLSRLKALGYLGRDGTLADAAADFVHTNSIAYNLRLDQILLSVNQYSEIWILDHSTSTREASGHTGGRAGRGGDLLYRWGNPQVFDGGTHEDRQLFAQHDASWIPPGHPGAGNLLVFNNGAGRPGDGYSSVLEIAPPVDADGRYRRHPGGAFPPEGPVWQYTAEPPESFYADFISGAQRLMNGNTLICSGPDGRFFEVTREGDIVWSYLNPYSGNAPNPAGDPPYSVFRATHIPPHHPALAGRTLEPLDPQPRRDR
ncbi:MAG: hypothetical protein GY769_15060 [bacterium]|nr:hypothetical protein [bacterium]